MPDQSTQSILIAAPPEQVMSVIADFAAYPQWAGSIKSATVLQSQPDGRARRVAFKLDAGAVRDEYELDYVWDGQRRVSWQLVRGQLQKDQRGSYELRQTRVGTEVTYSLAVDLAIPMLGMLRRKAEKVIMDTALKELKRRAEGERSEPSKVAEGERGEPSKVTEGERGEPSRVAEGERGEPTDTRQ